MQQDLGSSDSKRSFAINVKRLSEETKDTKTELISNNNYFSNNNKPLNMYEPRIQLRQDGSKFGNMTKGSGKKHKH